MDSATQRAKEMLQDQLSRHPDPGVRMIAAMAEIGDDHPSVVRIAKALRARDPREQ